MPCSAQPPLTGRCFSWPSSIWGGLGFWEDTPKAAPSQCQPLWLHSLALALQMLCDIDQVTAMRFILRQPSPVWLHFTIEDLQIFPPGQKVSRCQSCPTARHGQGAWTSHCPALYLHFPLELWGAHTGMWLQVLVLCWGTWDPLVLQWCWEGTAPTATQNTEFPTKFSSRIEK